MLSDLSWLPKRVGKNSSREEEGISSLCPLIGQCVAESLGGGIDSREEIDLGPLQFSFWFASNDHWLKITIFPFVVLMYTITHTNSNLHMCTTHIANGHFHKRHTKQGSESHQNYWCTNINYVWFEFFDYQGNSLKWLVILESSFI